MFDELKQIKSGKKELKEFGLTIGGVLLLFGGIALWRGKGLYPYLFGCGGLLIILGLAAPAALKPLQKAWMALAVIIGFFMSRIVLSILFYAIVTPMALLAKAFGKDVLDEKIDKTKPSYWHMRPQGAKNRSSYEKQF